jgi:hypothetical protein
MIAAVKNPGKRTQGHKGQGDDPNVGWDKELRALLEKAENLGRQEDYVIAMEARHTEALKLNAMSAPLPVVTPQVVRPHPTNLIHGEKYTVILTRAAPMAAALQKAIDLSGLGALSDSLKGIVGRGTLWCKSMLTLDSNGATETLLHCRPLLKGAHRRDFVLTKFFSDDDSVVEYPARIEAMFNMEGIDGPYMIVKTMTKPILPHRSAVMPFAKTKFDAEGLWVIPVTAIVKRVLVVPIELGRADVECGEFYVYPDTLPDILS